MSEEECSNESVTRVVIEPTPNRTKTENKKSAVTDDHTGMTTVEIGSGTVNERLFAGPQSETKYQSDITNFMITTKSKPIGQRDSSVMTLETSLGSPVKPSTSVAKTEDSSQQDDAVIAEDVIKATPPRVARAESIKIEEDLCFDQIAKKMSRGSSRASLNSRAYRALKDLTCCGTKLESTSEENIHYTRDPGI